jgi:hypothetical protein
MIKFQNKQKPGPVKWRTIKTMLLFHLVIVRNALDEINNSLHVELLINVEIIVGIWILVYREVVLDKVENSGIAIPVLLPFWYRIEPCNASGHVRITQLLLAPNRVDEIPKRRMVTLEGRL